MLNRERTYLPAVASALLGAMVFAVAIGATYIYDDPIILQKDERIQHPQLWHLLWTQAYNRSVDNLFRPLVSMSFAFQWFIHGDKSWAFHLVNLLLHAGVCACVAECTRRLLGFRAAMMVGLLFAVHPVHSEAVISIADRPELMCALGIFGALILFQRPLTTMRVLAITSCGIFALLSKEQGMLLPLLLLILYLANRFFPSDSGASPPALPDPKQRSYAQLLVMLLCFTLAIYIVWREQHLKFWWDRSFLDWAQNPMVQSKSNPHGGAVGIDRLLVPLVILGRYTAMLIAPTKLSIDYGSAIIGWTARASDPYLWIGVLAVAGWIIGMIIALARRSAVAIFVLLAFGLTYGMISNLLALIGTIFGERLIYIPSAFFLILLAVVVAKVPSKILVPILSILIVLGAARSITYAARWNDRLKFYSLALADQPGSIRLHITLAEELRARGQLLEAEKVDARGRELAPDYCDIWMQSGQIALELKKFDEARRFFEEAVKLDPSIHSSGWFPILERLEAEYRAAATTQSVPQ